MKLSEMVASFGLHDDEVLRFERSHPDELRLRVQLCECDHEEMGGPPLPQGVGTLVFVGVKQFLCEPPLQFEGDIPDEFSVEIYGGNVVAADEAAGTETLELHVYYRDYTWCELPASQQPPYPVLPATLTITAREVLWEPDPDAPNPY